MYLKKIPSDLMQALNKAAFKGTPQDIEKIILQMPAEHISDAIPDAARFYQALEDMAFQKDPVTFKLLLTKFGEDEKSLRAILRGFERDEVFAARPDMGFMGQPDIVRGRLLEEKRQLLQDFVVKLQVNRHISPDIALR